jgi:hypothetical protein
LADPGEIEVIDPTHPLYGRHFPIHSISHPVDGPAHVFVCQGDHVRLRIPLSATNLAPRRQLLRPTKFTLEAIQQMLALVKEWETPCNNDSPPSGNVSPHP